MGESGTEYPRNRRISLRAWVFVVLISVASTAGYLLVRSGSSYALADFPGVCGRLQAAGLQLLPQDWFCWSQTWSWRMSADAASLLLGLGYVIPCAILARTGRRLTAFLPMLAGLILGGAGDLVGIQLMPDHGTLAKLVVPIALAAPIAAIALTVRPRRAPSPRPDLQLAIFAALICGAATWAVVVVADWVFARHFGAAGGSSQIWAAATPMVVFGFMLGPDRRWWPWSFAPIALLLSAGPSLAMFSGPARLVSWSQFGLAAPLAVIGIAWSAWRPLVDRMSARVERAEGEETAPGPAAGSGVKTRRTRIRPVVVLDALGAGLLAVAIVVFGADPLPAEQSAALPTYVGLRVAAADVRTKMDLRMAIAALDTFAAGHGDYTGFDAEAGAALEPSLAWQNGSSASEFPGAIPELTMAIVSDTAARVRIAALSEGGGAFCMQRTPDGVTFGRSTRTAGAGGRIRLLRRAIENCGATPWSVSAVRVPDTSGMCDGLDYYGGYVTCRMVQASVATTLRQTKPD
jgi:hypothetical protein